MKKNSKLFFWFLIPVLLLAGCFAGPKLSVVNLAHYYNEGDFTNPEFFVWHDSDTISTIQVAVNFDDFSYDSSEESDVLRAEALIRYRLYTSYQYKDVIDSLTIRLADSTDQMTGVGLVDTASFTVPAVRGKDYIARFDIWDVVGKTSTFFFVEIPKRHENSRFDFRIFDDQEGLKNDVFIDSEDVFKVEVPAGTNMLFVRYYNRDFPVALPPFVMHDPPSFDYDADSIFSIGVREGTTPYLSLPDNGFYHFQADTSSKSGITLFNFYDGFPDVVGLAELLHPLKYITTSKEFEEIRNSPDQKVAIDQFWLKNAGNPLRAKSMISKYYGRVREVNRYFSSYLEGWKTDRGLIYIVFGEPRIVYRSDDFEEWIYGEEGNSNSLRFQFQKIENPFTDNDYVLIKSLSYKEKWYDAVSGWRR